MTAIFIDQTLRIKFCATYSLDTNGGAGYLVRAVSDADYGYEYSDCMPNTHIDAYGCMGNYEKSIRECILNHDYIGAIEQCIASCKSLNFGDYSVMGKFMGAFYDLGDYCPNTKCIELPDGVVTTPGGAIGWLKKQEEEVEEDE